MADDFPLPLPAPLARVVDDHVRAWGALAAAAAEIAALPALTARRIVAVDLAPPADPAAEARDRIAALEAALAESRGHVAGLEARLRELGEAHQAQVEGLRRAYDALELDAATRAGQAVDDQRLALYQALEPLLTQLPAVRGAVAAGREVAATDLLDLLGPLDEALAAQGIRPVGAVGDVLPFEPARHQATGATPAAGDPVMVKLPGYVLGDRVLRRARVQPEGS
jgi:molecular chaperone GrpE (heat shock protein)